MIDVKELRIGNYVTYSADNPDCMAVLAKIEAIYGNFVNVSFGVYDDQGEEVPCTENRVPVRELYPIEINIDQLKYNGFDLNGVPEDLVPVEDRDFSDDTYVWATGNSLDDTYTQVCLYLDYRYDDWIASIDTPSIGMESIRLKYVHELQNLLTLMRIEKDIIL